MFQGRNSGISRGEAEGASCLSGERHPTSQALSPPPYRGPQAIVEGVFGRLLPEWPNFQVEVGEIVGGPDVVTMFGRYKATHGKTKKRLDVQVAHTWWIRDGKIARFQQMVDTAAVARAR